MWVDAKSTKLTCEKRMSYLFSGPSLQSGAPNEDIVQNHLT